MLDLIFINFGQWARKSPKRRRSIFIHMDSGGLWDWNFGRRPVTADPAGFFWQQITVRPWKHIPRRFYIRYLGFFLL
jgi:hypothetical protein